MAVIETKATFTKYPAYKDSGEFWLKNIPAHWELMKGKFLFKKEERPVREEDEIVTCFRNGQVTLRTNRRTEGFTNALKEHGYQGIRKGDLVIHQMDAFAGAIGVSDSDGKSTPVYSVCTPRIEGQVNQHYYAYFLRNMANSNIILSLAKGIRERSTDFRFKDFGELNIVFPSIEEQTAIANFLDDKTAKVDRAIAQKERLIALLKERKQIIIQNAVTKGLDPNVKLKDSGVEWIGEIPEGWKVKRLKFLLNELNIRSETGAEELLSLSKYSGVIPRSSLEERAGGAESLIGYKIVKENHLLINKMQAVNGLIAVAKISGITSPDYSVYYVKDESLLNIDYLCQLVLQPQYLAEFKRRVTGVMEGFIRLYTDDLYDVTISLPPIQEQTTIVTHIETQSAKIDHAISLQQTQIEKLKEYKASLIDSAVTGKIKVNL